MICSARLLALFGPPAKKFVPPPAACPGKPLVPYLTAVKFEAVPQPGGGATSEALAAPPPASAPGFWTRLPEGTTASAMPGPPANEHRHTIRKPSDLSSGDPNTLG